MCRDHWRFSLFHPFQLNEPHSKNFIPFIHSKKLRLSYNLIQKQFYTKSIHTTIPCDNSLRIYCHQHTLPLPRKNDPFGSLCVVEHTKPKTIYPINSGNRIAANSRRPLRFAQAVSEPRAEMTFVLFRLAFLFIVLR